MKVNRTRNDCNESEKYLPCEQIDAEYPVIFMMIKNTCIIVNYLMLDARLQASQQHSCHKRIKQLWLEYVRVKEIEYDMRHGLMPYSSKSLVRCWWIDAVSSLKRHHIAINSQQQKPRWHSSIWKPFHLEYFMTQMSLSWTDRATEKWKNVNSYLISRISCELNLGIVICAHNKWDCWNDNGKNFAPQICANKIDVHSLHSFENVFIWLFNLVSVWICSSACFYRSNGSFRTCVNCIQKQLQPGRKWNAQKNPSTNS